MKIFNRGNGAGCEFIIAGLGNPGPGYAETRHNIGFRAAEYISGRTDTDIKKLKHMSLTAKCRINGVPVLLMKPQTYMNRSGEAIRDAMDFYKLPPEKVIVIFDDCSFDPGVFRIKKKGSDGGHNGIKSVIEHIGQDFPRIKIGVGQKPHPDFDLADFVLSKFTRQDFSLISANFDKIFQSCGLIINGEVERAMNIYN